LRELAGDQQATAAKSVEAMDMDESEKAKIPKTGRSTAQSKCLVDLDAMAFSQGGHLMSNKKCKLLDGSFKQSKKGYEEIHIPAPKKQPLVESEIVQTSQLPEWACNFSSRLKHYDMKVGELTGDSQMTKQQISEASIIVTTPEKWDIITHKQMDTSYTNLVRLIIVDEIHLLHNEHGPVIEALVIRTIRRMEQTLEYVRLVGLSATLPNYQDITTFLCVDLTKDLFYFDASYP
jgi:hypothetical protein